MALGIGLPALFQGLILCALIIFLICLHFSSQRICKRTIDVHMEIHPVHQFLKIEVSSASEDPIETIKKLQFTLPTNYTQQETTIYDRRKVTYIISVPQILPLDSVFVKGIFNQILLCLHEKLELSPSQPVTPSDSFYICLQKQNAWTAFLNEVCRAVQ